MASTTEESLRRFNLSAQEIQDLTNWPFAIIEEWLNMIENALSLAKTIDSGIDNGDILEGRVTALEISVATLSSQITAINQDISDIRLDITTINNQITSIIEGVEDINQQVASIFGEIGLINAKLSKIVENQKDVEQLMYTGGR